MRFKCCFHEWKTSNDRRDLVDNIERRIRDKIQTIEDEQAKPNELMTDFFDVLNKKYNIDPNKDQLDDEAGSRGQTDAALTNSEPSGSSDENEGARLETAVMDEEKAAGATHDESEETEA